MFARTCLIGLIVTNVLNKIFSDLCARVNDCVLKVNNVDLTNVEYRTAVQAISRGEVVNMVSEIILNIVFIWPIVLDVVQHLEPG